MTGPASPGTMRFSIRGPLARDDLPALYDRFCALVGEHAPARVLCDVAGVAPDAVAVDALARMQLAARRANCTVTLTGMEGELRALVALMGLTNVLVSEPRPPAEPRPP
ncbi:STAS domain-containing protein [Conexibacter sp. JD483]|uniref:STAS domain-containing protein n=1 Tax=unclassified Conexibacter TaxID=2627773 RepID=UPI002721816C|nr:MULTISPECIES: STAS domain-containing protein [unclassified Conexibacter]MDO8184736.1 STAS domain-containing protein [Conexibacter sp. CPCC 205706]MDO8196511.1 STAS domain-containing protein [Conexibacter sp. CPCC 205762]MDR9368997.1 STAS domain-containing protein [Conexibacter sp. JD483]